MDPKIKEMIESADLVRINAYVNMFDRVLLYSIAAGMLPKEVLQESINICEKMVKTSINHEANNRTKYLESTVEGRRHKLEKVPDGEDIRLTGLNHWNITKHLIKQNLRMDKSDNDFGEDFEQSFED